MSIVDNKKAFFDYFIEERYEAGLVLEGWEVKAIRAGRAQIKEAYVVVRNAEIFLIGSHISPLSSTSTHIYADPTRTRKLLLNENEIRKLIGKVEQRGYTLVPLNMHLNSANNDLRELPAHDSGLLALPITLFTGFALVVLFLTSGKPYFTFDSTF